MESFANIGIYISYVLIGLALLGMFAGIVIAVAQNFKEGGIAVVIGVAAIVVFFGIGYVLSDDNISQTLLNKNFSDVSAYKKSGAGLITFYILAVIAAVLLVVDLIKGFIDGN